MSSLEGGGQREEGTKPSRECLCWPDSPKLERGVCTLLEAAQRWVSRGHLFPGNHTGWDLKPLGRILATLTNTPELCLTLFLGHQVPCSLISGHGDSRGVASGGLGKVCKTLQLLSIRRLPD